MKCPWSRQSGPEVYLNRSCWTPRTLSLINSEKNLQAHLIQYQVDVENAIQKSRIEEVKAKKAITDAVVMAEELKDQGHLRPPVVNEEEPSAYGEGHEVPSG